MKNIFRILFEGEHYYNAVLSTSGLSATLLDPEKGEIQLTADADTYEVQHFTGFRDGEGADIYEGDGLNMFDSAGDYVAEFCDEMKQFVMHQRADVPGEGHGMGEKIPLYYFNFDGIKIIKE